MGLRCQLSYFVFASIQLLRYHSFFRLVLLLSGDVNVNQDQTTVNNNSIPLNTLPFHNDKSMKGQKKNKSEFVAKFVGIIVTVIFIQKSLSNSLQRLCYTLFFH